MATDFGTDIDLWPDINPAGTLLTGANGNTLVLAQALLRRLTTPRGGLFYDAGYGTDIRAFLGESMTASSTASIQQAIEREVTQDERVLNATASVVFVGATGVLVGHLTVQTSDGPFTLVISVTALSVTLLKAG
jgi:hypothetical protein